MFAIHLMKEGKINNSYLLPFKIVKPRFIFSKVDYCVSHEAQQFNTCLVEYLCFISVRLLL